MPAAPRDWADPYLDQAREDLRAAWSVHSEPAASTFCMLLQMVFEKLAKAAYARAGNVVPKTHRAASHLFAILRRHPMGTRMLQANPNVQAFVAELEEAHPAIAGRHQPPSPQLEYPWEDETGAVCSPNMHLPLARRVADPRDRIAADCLKFADALAKQLPQIVP